MFVSEKEFVEPSTKWSFFNKVQARTHTHILSLSLSLSLSLTHTHYFKAVPNQSFL
jgi:hypothetical protein